MPKFVSQDEALRIAKKFILGQLGHEPRLIGVNKFGSKKQKELMEWRVIFETTIDGNPVDGPTVVSVSAKTGEVLDDIQEIT